MIKDLNEFTAFLKICRKQGVTEVKFNDVSVVFGELSKKARKEADDDNEIQTEELTPEQLMFYSAGGITNENHQG